MKLFFAALALCAFITTFAVQVRADSCNFPESLKGALDAAKEYKNDSSCSRVLQGFNKSGKGGKIVVSDYTKKPAMMYIFDESGANCIKALPVDYGNGAGKGGEPKPSCEAESQQTPAGFHVTDENHASSKYPPPKSLGMVGLESQQSEGRGILLHGAFGNGGAHTWGCSGVAKSEFEKVHELLAGGSLIYNFFGDATSGAPGCKDVGKKKCSPDTNSGLRAAAHRNKKSSVREEKDYDGEAPSDTEPAKQKEQSGTVK